MMKNINASRPEYPKLVHRSCAESNFYDANINRAWEIIKIADDPETNAIEDDIFEFRDRTHSYIHVYCFPNNITFMGSKPARCPIQPIKLNVNVPYNISRFNHSWTPQEINMTAYLNFDDGVFYGIATNQIYNFWYALVEI